MRFTAQVVLLISALASTKVAAVPINIDPHGHFDPYSLFYTEESDQTKINEQEYSLLNSGCFQVDGAVKVSFKREFPLEADGPFCLHAYHSGFCPKSQPEGDTVQQFQHLKIPMVHAKSMKYDLMTGMRKAASYKWEHKRCPVSDE